MVLSSMVGGLIVALVLISFQKSDSDGNTRIENPAVLTNYVFDSTDFVVPEGLNFVFAAKSATPSVVHIRTAYGNGKEGNSPFNEYFRDFFGDRFREYQNPNRGAGSGVIMREDGYIVTNNHVVEDATEIEVVLNDNRSYQAEIIGTDPSTDTSCSSRRRS